MNIRHGYHCAQNLSLAFLILWCSRSCSASSSQDLIEWRFCFVGSDSSIERASGSATPNFWHEVSVPRSFNLGESLGNRKAGYAWYTTDLKLRSESVFDYFLKFDGVCLRAKVFVDGKLAGQFRHAYLPFRLNITPFIKNKKAVRIAVQVDNRLLQGDFPDRNCDGWWIYGGLMRGVRLVEMPKLRIENVQMRTFWSANDDFRAVVSYEYATQVPDSVSVSITAEAHNGIHTTLPDEGLAACTLGMENVRAWNPEDPFLYDIELTPFWRGKPGKSIHLQRGFSQLLIKDGKLTINGKPIFLRGIGRHDVIAEKGPLLSREERIADLAAIKATGANMLRIAHFPQHGDVYEICDSLGLIVMDEMPAWKTYPGFLGDSSGQNLASEYMARLIHAHGNYTCVGLWCIANEIQSVKDRVANYVKSVADFTRAADSSRLVTYTSYFYQFDKAYQYVDVASVNEYFGWYLGSVNMLPALFESIRKECPGKPIIVTEFGASAGYGIHNPNSSLAGPAKSIVTKDFSEDHQALFHKSQIEQIWKSRNACSGAVVWCYNDFMEYRKKPNPPTVAPWVNGMGLVTQDRKAKAALKAVEDGFLKIKAEMLKNGGY